jgi:hypothetical protein
MPTRLMILLCLLSMPSIASAKEIRLEILAPRQDCLFVPLETTSGWPLVLQLTANGTPLIGIGCRDGEPFPGQEQTGFLVYTTPPQCFPPADPEFSCNKPESEELLRECLATEGEIYVEFTPDVDQPGVPDLAGSPQARSLPNPFADLPRVTGTDPTGRNFSIPIGPLTDSKIYQDPDGQYPPAVIEPDGYGYGADDDLPGLVLLSDTGVGLVFDNNLVRRVGSHNLAGFLNSVAYEIKNTNGRISIVASMVVPEGLFTPLVLADLCLSPRSGSGRSTSCIPSGAYWSLDGGELRTVEPSASERARMVIIRAFVVNGTAPSILYDLNSDLRVDAEDAKMAGYRLLSQQVVLALHHVPCPSCPIFPFDLDGNQESGEVILHLKSNKVKAGPSAISPP